MSFSASCPVVCVLSSGMIDTEPYCTVLYQITSHTARSRLSPSSSACDESPQRHRKSPFSCVVATCCSARFPNSDHNPAQFWNTFICGRYAIMLLMTTPEKKRRFTPQMHDVMCHAVIRQDVFNELQKPSTFFFSHLLCALIESSAECGRDIICKR